MSQDVLKARIMTVMRNLPPMPQVTQKLLAVIRDEDSSANDVTKVLSSDQALAGKVLKLVNSSFYGVPQEIKTISRAVVMLGFTGVRNLALGFGSVEALGKMTKDLDMKGFWNHAMANAVAAQSLAPYMNRRTDPEEAFIAGLMHDIGAYVLASAVPDTYKDIMGRVNENQLQLENEATGFTHVQVGQGLIQFWGLPESFANAARYHHDFSVLNDEDQALTALVALADVLACINCGGFETPASEEDLGKLISVTGITNEQIKSTLLEMDQKMEDMSSFMSISGVSSQKDLTCGAVAKKVSCVVSTEVARREWVQTLLQYFGHELFPMDTYFNQGPGCGNVELVLLDPQCLTAQQLDRLLKYLSTQSAQVAILHDQGSVMADAVKSFPTLKFVFSRQDLAEVLAAQTV
ncbi:MAG: HDOD domain-containing protein [Gemmatimonadales bacterium]|nr:HDOD domain-containing protein [Gemmatimonadales bacterium]